MNSLLSMSCDNNLCNAIISKDIVKIDELIDTNLIDIHTCSRHISPIYFALELDELKIVEHLKRRKANFRSPRKTGPFLGFLPIHFVSLDGNLTMMNKFKRQYINYDTAAADGVTAIQLAVLRGNYEIAIELLRRGSSIETKVTYSQFKKYGTDKNFWNQNFGNEMSLSTYAFFNNDIENSHRLYDSIACKFFFYFDYSFELSDKNNKSLLMYAVESHKINSVNHILEQRRIKRMNLGLNQRDNAGFAPINYLITPQKIEMCKQNEEFELLAADIYVCLCELMRHKVNVNMMINNDLETLPLYLAAKYGLAKTLKELLLKQSFYTPLFKPLFYALQNYIINGPDDKLESIEIKPLIDPRVIATVQIIIEDIFIKTSCKYPVDKGEIQLMKQVTKYDNTIRDFTKSLNEKLQLIFNKFINVTVKFNNEETSLYAALTASEKEYFNTAKKYIFMPQLDTAEIDSYHLNYNNSFGEMIDTRIDVTKERINLMNKWESVVYFAIKSFFLPFDCIQCIVEFLTNEDLNNFILSFSIIL